jgi:hypothetical protein
MKLHKHVARVPAILLMTFLSVLASIAISLLVVSSFSFLPVSETRIVVAGADSRQDSVLDDQVLRASYERVVTLFDVSGVKFGVYPESSLLGYGALLSTNGWVVTAVNMPALLSNVRALDSQGLLHTVVDSHVDSGTGLRYIKLSGEGFRIFDLEKEVLFTEVVTAFSLTHNDVTSLLVEPDYQKNNSAPFVLSGIVAPVKISPNVSQAGVLVTDRGTLFGVTASDGALIPSTAIAYSLPFVLRNENPKNISLPYTGMWVVGTASSTIFDARGGLLITHLSSAKKNEVLKVGDIITRINNQLITPALLYNARFFDDTSLPATVLRGGIEVDVIVPLLRL